MTFWVAGAAIGGAYLSSRASSKAASTQAAATSEAADLQSQVAREQLALQQRIYEEGVARQQPWLKAGEQALNKLVPLTDYQQFGMKQFQADPGYAFRLSEGQKALERSAAARGGLMGGATGKALLRYGQEMGSQEFANAFNRFQTERAARLQPLQSLAGVGQTTAQQIGAAGQQFAGQSAQTAGQMAANVGDLMTSGAAARASGYVGGANAVTGALGTYLNYSQGQNLLNALRTPSAPAYQTPGYGAPTVGYQDPYASFRYGSST